jgi:serine/threonine protein kinase
MEAERWRRARALFEQLVEVPQAEWEARLQALCPDDAGVREEALSLLRADAQEAASTALSDRAPDLLAAAAEQEERLAIDRLAGTRAGPFRLVRELGRGGMGQVWLAERADGEFAQQVAIKLVRSGWDAGELLARFRAERQILASLVHPHIAHLVDGGVTPDGKPWLALEYVDGSNLREFCDTQRLDIDARLRLFLSVCEAVAYAHAHLVVHRDLKPSNVLVDTQGQAKLLDFGIAKLLDADTAASATRVFTPEYAAPEQVRGEVVTTAVDVYALGLLLYELLTGRRPYKLENSTPAAYERAILEQEPTRPSVAVTREGEDADALAAQRHLTPALLARELRGDLDAVVMKALRKEPAQRYASVADFAADIQRHLEHRPVLARRGDWRYRTSRFLRRHALAALLSTLAVAGLVVGLGLALWQAKVARAERDRAEIQAETARRTAAFLSGVFANADPERRPGEKITAQQLLAEGEREIHTNLSEQPQVRAGMLEALGWSYIGLDEFDAALPLMQEAVTLRSAGADRNAESSARRGLARDLTLLRRFPEAEAEHLRARDAADRSTPAGEEAYLDALHGLGVMKINSHKHDEAIAILQDVLQRQRQRYGAEDPRTLGTVIHLAYVLSWEDRPAEGFALIDPLWKKLTARTVPGDVRRNQLLSAESDMLERMQRFEEAVPLAQETLDVAERIYGRDHHNFRNAQKALGLILYKANRPAEAAPILKDAIDHLRGDNERTDFESLAFPLRDYGRSLEASGRFAEAIAPLQEAASLWLDPKHGIFRADALAYLIRAERRAGRYGDAKRELALAFGLADLDKPDAVWERTELLLERVRIDIDSGTRLPDCGPAQQAAELRSKGDDKNLSLQARAIVAACLSIAGDRSSLEAMATELKAARAAGGLVPIESEAVEYALNTLGIIKAGALR